jgi:hypothetical protein
MRRRSISAGTRVDSATETSTTQCDASITRLDEMACCHMMVAHLSASAALSLDGRGMTSSTKGRSLSTRTHTPDPDFSAALMRFGSPGRARTELMTTDSMFFARLSTSLPSNGVLSWRVKPSCGSEAMTRKNDKSMAVNTCGVVWAGHTIVS